MQLELKPANKLTYKLTPLLHLRAGLRLTPQMKLAISLLQMPLVKLREYVKQQVEENPLLEIENIEAPLKETESDLNYNPAEDEEKQDYRESLITNPVTLRRKLPRKGLIRCQN